MARFIFGYVASATVGGIAGIVLVLALGRWQTRLRREREDLLIAVREHGL